jgi:hypothetical protein
MAVSKIAALKAAALKVARASEARKNPPVKKISKKVSRLSSPPVVGL